MKVHVIFFTSFTGYKVIVNVVYIPILFHPTSMLKEISLFKNLARSLYSHFLLELPNKISSISPFMHGLDSSTFSFEALDSLLSFFFLWLLFLLFTSCFFFFFFFFCCISFSFSFFFFFFIFFIFDLS